MILVGLKCKCGAATHFPDSIKSEGVITIYEHYRYVCDKCGKDMAIEVVNETSETKREVIG